MEIKKELCFPIPFPARHISVSINRPAEEVYGFVVNGANLPQWASGLSGGSIKKTSDGWIAESPMGQITIQFAETNNFGVLDHDVTVPSGEVFDNPMRVIANNDGSEVVFTLYKRTGVSDEDFEKDAETIAKDLQKLKEILEQAS
jgi:hypothetical protein